MVRMCAHSGKSKLPMSFNNPTTIKVGMTGTFSGLSYRVLGRSVLGVVDEGRSYYWNEFNLRSDKGESVTLVYEVTERGGEWRWFTMFDPDPPLTAAEAASMRVGDPLNVDGTELRVTLRDNSRVYYVEGEPPEGEDVGTKAEYFNAEAGTAMVVVSWTGDEVEFYHGKTITPMMVGHAFNIPPVGLSEYTPPRGASYAHPSFPFGAIVALGIFIIFLLIFIPAISSSSRPPAVVRAAAPSAALTVDRSGKLAGKTYTIVSDALVEVREMGTVFQRHEFHLRDEDGNGALLIHGWKPGANDWYLFTLLQSSEEMTPQQAAAVQIGKSVTLGNTTTTIDELFSFTTLSVKTSDILQSKTGQVFYAFSGQAGPLVSLERWNDSAITFYSGSVLHEDPVAAFSGK